MIPSSFLPVFSWMLPLLFTTQIHFFQGHEIDFRLRGPENRQAYSSYAEPVSYANIGPGSVSGYESPAAASGYHYSQPYPYPTYAQSVYTGDSQLQQYLPVTSTASSTACKSTTFRTNLGCYCALVGQRCFTEHSVCVGDQNGDGTCGCLTGYVAYKYKCITTAAYINITTNGGTTPTSFIISGPTIIASCLLPINAVVGRIPGVAGVTGMTYSLSLISSAPLGDTTKYIDVDQSTGNLLYKIIAPYSLTNQVYQVVITQSNGFTTNKTFTVAYNCTAPTCSFDLGNSLIVDCLRYTIGDTIVRMLVTGSVSPTFFSMSLISSSSQSGNTFFRIDSTTGQIILQKMPHGGVFVEEYSVAATNAAGATCTAQTLTLTTTETCV